MFFFEKISCHWRKFTDFLNLLSPFLLFGYYELKTNNAASNPIAV